MILSVVSSYPLLINPHWRADMPPKNKFVTTAFFTIENQSRDLKSLNSIATMSVILPLFIKIKVIQKETCGMPTTRVSIDLPLNFPQDWAVVKVMSSK